MDYSASLFPTLPENYAISPVDWEPLDWELLWNPSEKTSNAQTYPPDRNIDMKQSIAPENEVDPWRPNIPLIANGQSQTYRQDHGGQVDSAGKNVQNSEVPPAPVIDLAENIKGMYRLLDLISESGSNGCVDKVIIAQDSLKRFINAICPGSYASLTKVDFKALDQFMIKPLGMYGSKVEIVRLLRSLNAVNEDIARSLLVPTELGGSRPGLSSGLYVLRLGAGQVDPNQEHHIVIYWPEDSTWDDSAASPVCRNRVTFMRYLTKMCDQVVVLLSAEHSASIVWGDEDSDAESRNEQEETAVSRPGFQVILSFVRRKSISDLSKMNSFHISHYAIPTNCVLTPSSFVPGLFHGETAQGFWTVTYVPQVTRSRIYDHSTFTKLSLKQLLEENTLVLSETLGEDAVRILVDVALSGVFPEQCNALHVAEKNTHEWFHRRLKERQNKACDNLLCERASLQRGLRDAVVEDVIRLFPSIERIALSSRVWIDGDSETTEPIRVDHLRQVYHGFNDIYKQHVQHAKFHAVKGAEFKAPDLPPGERTKVIQTVLAEDDLRRSRNVHPRNHKNKEPGVSSWLSSFTRIVALFSGPTDEESLRKELKKITSGVTDSDFLLRVKCINDKDLEAPIRRSWILLMQQEACKGSIQHDIEAKERKQLGGFFLKFIRVVNEISARHKTSVVLINEVQRLKKNHSSGEYKVTGRRDELQEPKLKFRVHLMDLTSDDKQTMKFNPKHIPKPTVSDQRSGEFHLPLGLRIVLLEKEKLLLVLADQDKHCIYLEHLSAMDAAIQRGNAIKALNRDKMGEHVLFAYDEAKRMLTVCASAKKQLYAFVFDETFRSLQGLGSSISLAPWYGQAEVSILQLSSMCGSDEVVLVGSNAQIRIFSFITEQFRPSSLQLPSLPSAIYPAPDGSCLLVLWTRDSQPSLTAYHWETFGSTDGISLSLPTFPLEGATVTSLVSRGRVFLLALDIDEHCVNSIAIDITRKVTEVVFQEEGSRNGSNNDARITQHNSLLDCHKEVWTRFPVLPAVKRRTITSLSERRQRTLTFITESSTRPFASYFSNLIQGFVRATKKPTGNELRGIKVSATDFGSFLDKTVFDLKWDVSRYRVGEWLVDLLCLIPIHIAVCRENRFVPLANGVISAELERILLGADVNQIVDHLSLGWYESIFQSYMASKPVKVVSSMGQQSVGKSFTLNHLVDTSFAGSAMRTTEGVWMSVTPTDDELIVALDFEGVDSVERSPQEDTLLVLFNTALSNLVLFRNNFAFGRDISGLFQSFQSSASVLDPGANPSLFQSTLDVVESDNVEIAREFSLKFQEIVEQEQDANFISRLHGRKLAIIPWPVIESKEFYKSFTTLKKRFDLQKVSHPTAIEFLHTIKTLMAKIKANDWGALSQTMAEHRAKSLSALLQIALATGFSEVDPEHEPLKDFDTELVVESHDTTAIFAISDGEPTPPTKIDKQITALLESWTPSVPRQFIPDSELVAELRTHLNRLIDLRINHVRSWLDCNLARFKGEHAAIEDLRRRFNIMVIEMKTNVQLCGAQCASCHLLCIRSRLHINEGDHSCNTDHRRVRDLSLFGTRVKEYVAPGILASIYALSLLICVAKLANYREGEDAWKNVMRHDEDDHMCSALVHMCGESIEATFTGKHETFQYTKYTQVAKRLQCVRTFRLDKRHIGDHTPIAKKASRSTSARLGARTVATSVPYLSVILSKTMKPATVP
ncbi:hypothetical protein BJV77DRAFT_1068323 [Russula vinacea]|nr:hypothetical protein BJV77DRAFT_1068323 [Russula vinacea]